MKKNQFFTSFIFFFYDNRSNTDERYNYFYRTYETKLIFLFVFFCQFQRLPYDQLISRGTYTYSKCSKSNNHIIEIPYEMFYQYWWFFIHLRIFFFLVFNPQCGEQHNHFLSLFYYWVFLTSQLPDPPLGFRSVRNVTRVYVNGFGDKPYDRFTKYDSYRSCFWQMDSFKKKKYIYIEINIRMSRSIIIRLKSCCVKLIYCM